MKKQKTRCCSSRLVAEVKDRNGIKLSPFNLTFCVHFTPCLCLPTCQSLSSPKSTEYLTVFAQPIRSPLFNSFPLYSDKESRLKTFSLQMLAGLLFLHHFDFSSRFLLFTISLFYQYLHVQKIKELSSATHIFDMLMTHPFPHVELHQPLGIGFHHTIFLSTMGS